MHSHNQNLQIRHPTPQGNGILLQRWSGTLPILYSGHCEKTAPNCFWVLIHKSGKLFWRNLIWKQLYTHIYTVALCYKLEGCGVNSWCNLIFIWPNPSSRTMALGLTQLPTEMSTRNFTVGKRVAGVMSNLTIIWAECLECVGASILKHLWDSTARYRQSLPDTYCHYTRNLHDTTKLTSDLIQISIASAFQTYACHVIIIKRKVCSQEIQKYFSCVVMKLLVSELSLCPCIYFKQRWKWKR
jgi:hypothetical protein